MPVEAAVGAERGAVAGLESQRGAQLPVARVADRIEERERVPAAGGENGDEHAASGPGGDRCPCDPLVEGARAERGSTVDGQGGAQRAGEELATVHSGA